ncbi:L,D-transpeptidase [Dendrosporobacter sp. 1207_IL3150]|uniref:L,D-transpeptidase n=1 Tax=Dendrosporobacter sp. 1207_IL3150 TaxID=3084054 RepID=UPI002FDAA1AC
MKKCNQVFFVFFIIMMLLQPLTVRADCNSAIIINLPSRTLEYYSNDILIREYRIAIGKVSTPTPMGDFAIIDKVVNPTWYPPGKKYSVPSGPENPLGYRWMGFLPTYGIHGTNAPWSIGGVVSNGCIRLREDAVEDLYELVNEGTPVYITYNRFKLRIGNDGVASLGIYPDVYGYKSVTAGQIKKKLADAGLDGLIDDVQLNRLISDVPDEQVPFAQLHKLRVNGNSINRYLVSIDGIKYAPALEIARSLQVNLKWDVNNGTVRGKRQAVSGITKGQTVYVPADSLPLLFAGRQEWRDADNCLYLQVPNIRLAGTSISYDIHEYGGKILVPVLTMAKVLGQKLYWESESGIVRNAVRKLPVEILNGEPYIDSNRISEFFSAKAVWNEDEQAVNIKELEFAIDYSMYLDHMGEFF